MDPSHGRRHPRFCRVDHRLTWPIIVLCVVLAALAFAVLDNPFQAVMMVWTRVMNVRQGIKDMNFLTFLAVMVLPWALLSVFFGANDVM